MGRDGVYCLEVHKWKRKQKNTIPTIILDNASQITIMQREMLTEYEEIKDGFELSGAINGFCARCIGTGKCPKPFENITGFLIEGITENILADNDIKNDWQIQRIFNKINNAYVLTNYLTGEEIVFNNRY